MTKYAIEVSWSDDDGVWIANVPDLPHCTADGPTPHDALAEAEIAVQAWLQAAEATGRPVPEPSPRAAHA